MTIFQEDFIVEAFVLEEEAQLLHKGMEVTLFTTRKTRK